MAIRERNGMEKDSTNLVDVLEQKSDVTWHYLYRSKAAISDALFCPLTGAEL